MGEEQLSAEEGCGAHKRAVGDAFAHAAHEVPPNARAVLARVPEPPLQPHELVIPHQPHEAPDYSATRRLELVEAVPRGGGVWPAINQVPKLHHHRVRGGREARTARYAAAADDPSCHEHLAEAVGAAMHVPNDHDAPVA